MMFMFLLFRELLRQNALSPCPYDVKSLKHDLDMGRQCYYICSSVWLSHTVIRVPTSGGKSLEFDHRRIQDLFSISVN